MPWSQYAVFVSFEQIQLPAIRACTVFTAAICASKKNDGLWLSSLFWFLLKTYILVAFFIWARATMPRIRIDQIMFFSWKFLLPASTFVLIVTALGVMYRHPWFSANRVWGQTPEGTMDFLVKTTPQIYVLLNAHEKAFFWVYNVLALAAGLFVLWFAWGVLGPKKRKHPQPRREVTWS